MALVGEIVLFVMPDCDFRPALVVREWNADYVQLQIFPDKVNDGDDPAGMGWFRSSSRNGTAPGRWQRRSEVQR